MTVTSKIQALRVEEFVTMANCTIGELVGVIIMH